MNLSRGFLPRYIQYCCVLCPVAGLGEHAIRDLNDNINKLLREKGHWEKQIKALGGANYASAGKSFDADGKELAGELVVS